MGALANELRCSRCMAGTGMDDNYLPHSWVIASISHVDGSWQGYFCETCRSEFLEWVAFEPTTP